MNAISVTYTDQQLRILIEEFIAMQRSEFTFKGVCSYILSYFIVPWKRVEQQIIVYMRAINWK